MVVGSKGCAEGTIESIPYVYWVVTATASNTGEGQTEQMSLYHKPIRLRKNSQLHRQLSPFLFYCTPCCSICLRSRDLTSQKWGSFKYSAFNCGIITQPSMRETVFSHHSVCSFLGEKETIMAVHFHSLGWTTSQKAKQSRDAWSSLREAYILFLLNMRQRSYFGSEDGRGRKNKKKSVVFPCKAQSMAEACVNGKSHIRLQFSECFCSFPSMCVQNQHSQSWLNVSMVFLFLIPAGSLNKLQKQSIVLRVSLLRFDLYWSFSFECAFLLLSSSSLHLPSAWDLILDLITPSFLLPQGDCIHAVCLIRPLSEYVSVCECGGVWGVQLTSTPPLAALQPAPVTTGISLETAGLHWCWPVCIQKKIMRLLGHLFLHNNDAQ